MLAPLGRDVRLGNDPDDPARRAAALNFHDRMNQSRDERSLYRHGRFLPAMLVIAAMSRDFWIGSFEDWHALTSRDIRNGSGTHGYSCSMHR
jgi:hypothetical protein